MESSNGRRRLPSNRNSITHRFIIDDAESEKKQGGYVIAGMYDDGTLGEIFIGDMDDEGSLLKGMLDAWAISISLGLQHGISLETFARKYSYMRFGPEGLTNNPEIRTARSIVDYIMRWLVSKFGDEDLCEELGVMTEQVKARKTKMLEMAA